MAENCVFASHSGADGFHRSVSKANYLSIKQLAQDLTFQTNRNRKTKDRKQHKKHFYGLIEERKKDDFWFLNIKKMIFLKKRASFRLAKVIKNPTKTMTFAYQNDDFRFVNRAERLIKGKTTSKVSPD